MIEDAKRLAEFLEGKHAWILCMVYLLAANGANDLDWRSHFTKILREGNLTLAREWRIPLDETRLAIAYLFTLERIEG